MNQLTFSIDHAESFAPEDYVVSDSNRPAYELVQSWPQWSSHAMWLSGPAACGKSHLAAIWQQRSNAAHVTLQAEEMYQTEASPAFLIDPLEASDSASQERLFHLLNHCQMHQRSLLIVSHVTPKALACERPDLQSRIRSLPHAALRAPDDVLLRAVWMKRLADKQLQVDAGVIEYLMRHCDRHFEAVRQWVEWLDRASLSQKRDITIPFVKTLLSQKS